MWGATLRPPFPFSDFYDVDHLKKYIEVATLEEFREACNSRVRQWGRVGDSATSFVADYHGIQRLSNFLMPKHWLDLPVLAGMPACSGSISADSKPFDDCCLGPYSEYVGEYHHGYMIDIPGFREVWSFLRPSRLVTGLIASYSRILGLDLQERNFDCLHVRRADFLQLEGCTYLSERECKYAGEFAAVQPDHYLLEHAISRLLKSGDSNAPMKLLIAAPHSEIFPLINLFGGLFEVVSVHALSGEAVEQLPPEFKRNDIRGMVEQHLCGEARRFIGNKRSSWSAHVYQLRRVNGLSDDAW